MVHKAPDLDDPARRHLVGDPDRSCARGRRNDRVRAPRRSPRLILRLVTEYDQLIPPLGRAAIAGPLLDDRVVGMRAVANVEAFAAVRRDEPVEVAVLD